MKIIKKINKLYLFLNFSLIITIISIFHPARADLLVTPTILITPSRVAPDCHTYTGCSVTVVKKRYIFPACPTRRRRPSCHYCLFC